MYCVEYKRSVLLGLEAYLRFKATIKTKTQNITPGIHNTLFS
jgi:hypothetical protein